MYMPSCPAEMNRYKEYPALKDMVYLDHAGTTLVSRSQLEAHHKDILTNIYGNPHSRSPSSQLTTDTIDQVRYRILQHFNTSPDKYSVIFTSGCTASLKLLAESFDFHGNCHHGDVTSSHGETIVSSKCSSFNSCLEANTFCTENCKNKSLCYNASKDLISNNCCPKHKNHKIKLTCDSHHACCYSDTSSCLHGNICTNRGSFIYLADNHTSVQGMRMLACQRAGQVRCVSCDHGDNLSSSVNCLFQHEQFKSCGNHLFVYPAQSNFSGRKYPLNWTTMVKKQLLDWQRSKRGQEEQSEECEGHWYSGLDAASLVSTSQLDLTAVQPDFITLSFYKMFGYPTGLGALLVRNDSAHVLKKTYFGGGTVAVSLPTQLYHVSRSSFSEMFEDGTVSFLDIISLRHGFDALQTLAGGMESISQHTFHLAKYFHNSLSSCCHGNGSPLVHIYCTGQFDDIEKQGAIVNFNILRSNGEYVGFSEVDKLAQLYNIHVRTGCFCNIGACQQFLKMTDEHIIGNFDAGHVCGDDQDLVDGKPTGSVRVSFGYMSTMEDAQKCLQFIVDCFLENTTKPCYYDDKIVHQPENTEITSNNNSNKNLGLFEDSEENVQRYEKQSFESYKKYNVRKQDESNEPFLKTTEKQTVTFPIQVKVPNSSNVERVTNEEASVDLDKVLHVDKNQSNVFASCEDKHLTDIFVYPVKSCAAMRVQQWPLSRRGLMYDREWMIVTESGIAMSQKRENRLCLLQPYIDLEKLTLTLEYPGMQPVHISVTYEETTATESNLCNSKVCGDRVQSVSCGSEVSDWLSEALQRPGCRLIRQKWDDARSSKLKMPTQDAGEVQEASQLSLANESQYLLVSRDSVKVLHDRIVERREAGDTADSFDNENLLDRFRGNLVVSGCEPFEEDTWSIVNIGNVKFRSQGMCTRCQMICLDQQTGERSREPLKTLAVWRGRKVPFGIHLCMDQDATVTTVYPEIKVGDPVFVNN